MNEIWNIPPARGKFLTSCDQICLMKQYSTTHRIWPRNFRGTMIFGGYYLVALLLSVSSVRTWGFSVVAPVLLHHNHHQTRGNTWSFRNVPSSSLKPNKLQESSPTCSQLRSQKNWFLPDDDEDHDNDDNWVTNEMLQRDLLADPQVKRKNKKGGKSGYKPLDNRDHLPFVVKQITPDPYTRPELKMQKQVKGGKPQRKSDLLASRLKVSSSSSSDNTYTVLGDFQLDKSTTSGDIICLADGRHYKVITARCQYKYAGGQRFVMVRKILEVKELTRAITERILEEQFATVTATAPPATGIANHHPYENLDFDERNPNHSSSPSTSQKSRESTESGTLSKKDPARRPSKMKKDSQNKDAK